ncbi:MAG: phosphatase PAP2 family protein [Proteobacteria bacterium]|nr:phosphatase PAP2 family protein [Pseudomonadota bacterium]
MISVTSCSRTIVLLVGALLVGCASSKHREAGHDPASGAFKRFVQQSVDDHRRHYCKDVLVDLLPPLLVAGTLANTSADRWIRDTWQEDIRSDESDNLARVFLHAGDAAQNKVSVPLYALGMIAGNYSGIEADDSPLATWGSRSLRANILGGPQAFALTYALGSHRPGVGPSDWNPMDDNDGVSGHSFYGAVPFLTAARMSEHAGWRYTFYALSALPAYARVNDNQHYTSQAVMGWSLAWLATRTVANGARGNDIPLTVTPMLLPDGGYLLFSLPF